MTDAPGISYARPRFRLPLPRWEDVREALARSVIRLGLWLAPEGNSVRYARDELTIAGMFEADSDYGGMLGNATIDMMKLFALEGHSGFSAGMATSLFEKVSRFQPLTPLTGEDSEWVILDYDDRMHAQNKRCGHVFKRADGTAYDIEGRIFREPNGVCFTSRDSSVDVTFPYVPTREYVDVPAGAED